MEPLNLKNYEAWLLDYAEGKLTAGQMSEVERFLENNPALREELERFDNTPIVPTHQRTKEWDDLEKPGLTELQNNKTAREQFFAYAIDGHLTKAEQKLLGKLCEQEALAKEFRDWKVLKLQADDLQFEKDRLFKFGNETELSALTYEHYLIALCERLLSPAQEKRLELYASNRINGANDLALAKNLKLKAAAGVFYPDKSNLFKKKKAGAAAWLLRVAAIFVLLLSGWFVINLINSPENRYAQRDTVSKGRTMHPIAPKKAQGLAQANLTASIKKPVTIDTESLVTSADKDVKLSPRRSEMVHAELIDALNTPALGIVQEPALAEIPSQIPQNSTNGSKQENKAANYKTLPQLAENYLARKMPQAKETSLNLAKRLAKETGQLLDVELEASTSLTEKDQSKTYLLRVGNFKIEHISAN